MSRLIPLFLAITLLLGGCASTLFNVPGGARDERVYSTLYPYYVEFCAVSEIRKRPGSAVDIEGGGPGGHSVLYLNGVCKKPDEGYPVVAMCDGEPKPGEGVGISVNAHYRNANWSAIQGRAFFFRGGLAEGEALTQEAYDRAQARAKAAGALDGIEFHPEVMRDKPASMSDRDYKYELSVATDYAIGFGRDRYCARVPVDRARMQGVVAYLNSVNTPYRLGLREFEWDVLRDNCAHLTHNALAIVGLWRHWPTDRALLVAAFDFPVPKNEFVNLMRRTNDLPIDDPEALFDDGELRGALQVQDWIATRPGGLAEAERAVSVNAIYDTNLRLIFFDEAITGPYQGRFNRIFSDPRYTDIAVNQAYFADVYDRILALRPVLTEAPDRAAFMARYFDHITRERAALAASRELLARISG
jgi:hypothetical protein